MPPTLNLLRRRRKDLSRDLFILLFALTDIVTGKFSLKGCGVTKGCIRVPEYCTEETCRYFVSYLKRDRDIMVEMNTRENWMAAGFNTIQKMEDTKAVICSRYAGRPQMLVTRRTPEHRQPYFDDQSVLTTYGVNILSTESDDTGLTCRFTRPLNGMYFPRANEDRYLIGAFGIFVMSNGFPQYHNNRSRFYSKYKVRMEVINDKNYEFGQEYYGGAIWNGAPASHLLLIAVSLAMWLLHVL